MGHRRVVKENPESEFDRLTGRVVLDGSAGEGLDDESPSAEYLTH